jgi:hypothetical protein
MATLQRCGNRLNCDKGSGAGAESNDIAIVYFIGNLFGYSAFRIEILDLSRPSKFGNNTVVPIHTVEAPIPNLSRL